jgi:hypothetical protein
VPIYARGAGKLAMVNAWMGTRGTVTHLHTDEHDNLLAQVRLCILIWLPGLKFSLGGERGD